MGCNNYNISRIKKIDSPLVLVFNRHHGDAYYIVNNLEELNELCLHVVKDYEYCVEGYEKPQPPEGITEEMIEQLPPILKNAAKAELIKYKRDLEDWEDNNFLKELYDKAIDGNALAARQFLEYSKDPVDEYFDVIFPTTVEDIRKENK